MRDQVRLILIKMRFPHFKIRLIKALSKDRAFLLKAYGVLLFLVLCVIIDLILLSMTDIGGVE